MKRFSVADVWADVMMDHLCRAGVTRVMVAPGSRSTPLVLAAHRRTDLKIETHYDERGLGFLALGVAKASLSPVAVIVTSGTAVANLLPAVIEAYMTSVPLILLTADRPPELWGTGANQCIFQDGIFSHYTVFHTTLPVPTLDIPVSSLRTILSQALVSIGSVSSGPIHLNCPFREPLYGETLTDFSADFVDGDHPIVETHGRVSLPAVGTGCLDGVHPNSLIEWMRAHRGVIVVGQSHDERMSRAVISLAVSTGWRVFADITSSLRMSDHPLVCTYYDVVGSGLGYDSIAPVGHVLVIGGGVVSKSLMEWLSDPKLECRQVMIKDMVWAPNISFLHRYVVTIEEWVEWVSKVASESPISPSYDMCLDQDLSHRIESVVAEYELSEPWVAQMVSRYFPVGWSLMIGNSLPVRLMDRYAVSGRECLVFSNRGASGIDGLLATAVGVGIGRNQPVVVWLGDMSFAYDVSSLQLIADSVVPIVVVVTNNHGGRIFNHLPVATLGETFERYFVLPKLPSIYYASRMVGLAYHQVQSSDDFRDILERLPSISQSSVIEIVTNADLSQDVQLAILSQLKSR